jgi:hypothetical protein
LPDAFNFGFLHTCGLQIDDEFERGRLQNSMVGQLGAFQAASVSAAASTFRFSRV